MPNSPTTVAILAGGPDAEREISLIGGKAVNAALADRDNLKSTLHVIDRLTQTQLRDIPGDVIFPLLHGPWGEGGPLQDLLETDGRPYVGCRPAAARLAMDKIATKLAAIRSSIPTAPAAILATRDERCPIPFPVVVKPVHEGSSVGVRFCKDHAEFTQTRASVLEDLKSHPTRVFMIEAAILNARELTVGILDGAALPIVEIKPAVAFYDYEAKYTRDDTRYVVRPELPAGLAERLKQDAVRLARELGVRHLCRVDYILGRDGAPNLLEVNTMPGFTSHSLFPMAAADAVEGPGLIFAELASRLIMLALRNTSKP